MRVNVKLPGAKFAHFGWEARGDHGYFTIPSAGIAGVVMSLNAKTPGFDESAYRSVM